MKNHEGGPVPPDRGHRAVPHRADEDARVAEEDSRFEQEHGKQAWEERYRSSDRTWSGSPNRVLVEEVGGLPPGTAFDAGAGEGADALWLAGRGWAVTAADISTTALARAAARAAEVGATVTWLPLDLTRDVPPGEYDLVSAFFLHMPRPQRDVVFDRLAGAVAARGTLLVVGHDLKDVEVSVHRPNLAEMGWTASELADRLRAGWTVDVAQSRPRPGRDADGHDVVLHDAVLRANRTR